MELTIALFVFTFVCSLIAFIYNNDKKKISDLENKQKELEKIINDLDKKMNEFKFNYLNKFEDQKDFINQKINEVLMQLNTLNIAVAVLQKEKE